jgi:hypothetical protein
MTVNYATLAQVKSALRITDQVDDNLLNTAIQSASRWVDGWCDRSFAPAAAGTAVGAFTSRDYTPTDRFGTIYIDDCVEVSEVRIDDDLDQTFSKTLQTVDYLLEPVNEERYGLILPFTRLRPYEDGYWPMFRERPTVRVFARYGWPAVPEAVREATILQSSRLFTRLDAPLGIAGFGDLGGMRVSRFVDPDVEMLLAPYRRVRYA